MDDTTPQAAVTLVVGMLAPLDTLLHGKDHRTQQDLLLSLPVGYHLPMTATRFLQRQRAREVGSHSVTFLPILQLMKRHGRLPLATAIGALYARILE